MKMEVIKFRRSILFFLMLSLLFNCKNDKDLKNDIGKIKQVHMKIELAKFPVPLSFKRLSYNDYMKSNGFYSYNKDNDFFFRDSVDKNYLLMSTVNYSLDLKKFISLKNYDNKISLLKKTNNFQIYLYEKKYDKIKDLNDFDYVLRENKEKFRFIEYLIFFNDSKTCVIVKGFLNSNDEIVQKKITDSIYSFLEQYPDYYDLNK